MLTEEESRALAAVIGFDPDGLEQFIDDAIEDPRQWTDAAYELETLAKAAKGLLALWRGERVSDLRAANAALTQSGVDEPRPGADTVARHSPRGGGTT